MGHGTIGLKHPGSAPRPEPALGRSSTGKGRGFPWPAPRRTRPSSSPPCLADSRQPEWAHVGMRPWKHTERQCECPRLTHLPSMMSISSQPATESQRCRRRATAGADELRCRTSHLAAVQKPPAHRIVVSEHARRSVPGTAILLVQTNGERGNASAQRRRSGASGEYTQHAVA